MPKKLGFRGARTLAADRRGAAGLLRDAGRWRGQPPPCPSPSPQPHATEPARGKPRPGPLLRSLRLPRRRDVRQGPRAPSKGEQPERRVRKDRGSIGQGPGLVVSRVLRGQGPGLERTSLRSSDSTIQTAKPGSSGSLSQALHRRWYPDHAREMHNSQRPSITETAIGMRGVGVG